MKGKSLLILSSIVSLILVLTILLFLPACTSGPTADKPLTLRYSCGLPPVDQQVKDAEWFADEVNRRTEGRVIIEVYSGAELFDVNAGPEATIMGSVDMCQASPVSGVLTEYNSVLKLCEVYFVWLSRNQVRAQIEDYRDLLWPLYEEIGLKPLQFFDRGQGGIISTKQVRQKGDLQGLQIRGPSATDQACLTALGATPVRLAAAEMYDALSKGAIDGIRTSLSGMVSYKLYEIAPYVVPVTYTQFLGYMNMDVWDGLPGSIQKTILEVAAECETRSVDTRTAAENDTLQVLRGACEIFEPSTAEIGQFQSALAPVIDEIVADAESAGYGDEARRFLEISSR